MTSQQSAGILHGIRILDLTRVMSGPYCTAMLADVGAEVIKVEMPDGGDDARHFGPFIKNESAYFLLLNRGKKSITLNLKSEKGIELIKKLAATSDVLIENFRPGVMKRLGIDYESIKQVNAKIVYASISGFGQEGPLSHRPAYDLIIQAMSGLMDITGSMDGPPSVVGDSISDVSAGIFTAWGITAALFERERTGEGRYVEVAMLDATFSMLLTTISQDLYTETTPRRVGNRHPQTYPVDCFPTKDGYVVIVVSADGVFSRFAKALGRQEMASDERFLTNRDRNANEVTLRAIIEAWTRGRTSEQVVEAMDAASIPSAPVQSITDVATSDHIAYRELISQCAHPKLGDIPLVHQPVKFSDVERPNQQSPPLLGEHNEEVLQSLLGLDKDEINSLKKQKVI